MPSDEGRHRLQAPGGERESTASSARRRAGKIMPGDGCRGRRTGGRTPARDRAGRAAPAARPAARPRCRARARSTPSSPPPRPTKTAFPADSTTHSGASWLADPDGGVRRPVGEPVAWVGPGQPGQAGAEADARLLGDDQQVGRAAERVGAGQRHRRGAGAGALVPGPGEPADQPAGGQRPGQPDRHGGVAGEQQQAVAGRQPGRGQRRDLAVQVAAPCARPHRRGVHKASATRAYRSVHHAARIPTQQSVTAHVGAGRPETGGAGCAGGAGGSAVRSASGGPPRRPWPRSRAPSCGTPRRSSRRRASPRRAGRPRSPAGRRPGCAAPGRSPPATG